MVGVPVHRGAGAMPAGAETVAVDQAHRWQWMLCEKQRRQKRRLGTRMALRNRPSDQPERSAAWATPRYDAKVNGSVRSSGPPGLVSEQLERVARACDTRLAHIFEIARVFGRMRAAVFGFVEPVVLRQPAESAPRYTW